MRRISHWLAFLLAATMVSVALVLTLMLPPAAASPKEPMICAADGVYASPLCCAGCHPDQYQSWTTTSHASASVDPGFRHRLESQAESNCYGCHATGYDAFSGRYALAGVTCEACHPPFHPGHSPEVMHPAAPDRVCANCHTAENGHDCGLGAECTSCHAVHTPQVTF